MPTDDEHARRYRRDFRILMGPLLELMDVALENGFTVTYATNVDPQDKKHKLVLLKITKEFTEEPSPQEPPLQMRADDTLTRDELLVLLMEEAAEIIQAASKCLRFGYDTVWPGYGRNSAVLANEVGDFWGVIDELHLCWRGEMQERRLSKIKRVLTAREAYREWERQQGDPDRIPGAGPEDQDQQRRQEVGDDVRRHQQALEGQRERRENREDPLAQHRDVPQRDR